MKTQPTAQLDGYAYDMLMFYLQEHNINIADIDHIEVELRKDKTTRIYHRHIKIIKKNGSKGFLENGAKLPERQHDGDYCYDVYATSLEVVNKIYIYGTGIHTAFPSHVPNTKTAICLQPFARSGIFKTGLILCNGVGIVDSNYRKEIHGMFYKICEGIEPIYKVGERFMQIALSNGEDIEWVQVNSLEELGTTDRDGGFSSTGRL